MLKKDNVLICGKGFLGQRLQEAFGCMLSDRRIHSYLDAQEVVSKHKPKILINCIGSTGQANVDDCENDKDKTLSSNAFVPLILAEACIRKGIKFVHVSSGCIYHYDYEKSALITEDDEPDFFDLFYSRTKIYAERALKTLARQYDILIPRVRIPLDDRPHPKNVLNKLIKYGKVIDLPNSVTYIPDFIQALSYLLNAEARGIYNVVNKGPMRYPDLMNIYKKYVPSFNYTVIDYEQLNLVRTNLILSTEKLEKTGFKVRKIEEVYEECVKNYIK
ncbi:MAG: sugar nucleotide-binding protein [Candidatus Omnitrophota bacterium]